MRDPDRIPKVCERLAELWNKVPDWRLGQLFCNIQRFENRDLFFFEDEDLIKAIEKYLEGN